MCNSILKQQSKTSYSNLKNNQLTEIQNLQIKDSIFDSLSGDNYLFTFESSSDNQKNDLLSVNSFTLEYTNIENTRFWQIGFLNVDATNIAQKANFSLSYFTFESLQLFFESEKLSLRRFLVFSTESASKSTNIEI